MKTYPWSESSSEAIRENLRTVRLVRISIAVNACLCSLLDIGTDARRSAEQREILCALQDLRVLTRLHRKYA